MLEAIVYQHYWRFNTGMIVAVVSAGEVAFEPLLQCIMKLLNLEVREG